MAFAIAAISKALSPAKAMVGSSSTESDIRLFHVGDGRCRCCSWPLDCLIGVVRSSTSKLTRSWAWPLEAMRLDIGPSAISPVTDESSDPGTIGGSSVRR